MLMLGGLLVHGSFWLPDAPLFAVVTTVSQAFRMGAFFAIAGFLTGRALMDRPAKRWLRRRMAQLGIPLVFGITVLSPTIWLVGVNRPAGAPGELPPMFHWHHLWFLVGLILYSIAAIVLMRIERRYSLIARLADAHGHRKLTARSIMCTVAVSSALLMTLATWLIPPPIVDTFDNAPLIAAYFPPFVFGMTLGREAQLADRFIACGRGYGIALAGIAIIYVIWFGAAQYAFAAATADRIGDAIRFGGISLCPTIAFVVILRSAAAIRRIPPALRNLSDASYTIYLLHLPIIGIVNAQFAAVAWHPYAKYMLAVMVAGTLSYALHRHVVRRSRTLALLLNGKLPQRGTPSATLPALG